MSMAALAPETKELIDCFVEDSQPILNEIEDIISDVESGERPAADLEKFALKIDGIMGCAKTLGLGDIKELNIMINAISNSAEGCKALGYKAFQLKDQTSVKIVAGFLAEALELVIAAMDDLKKGALTFDPKHAVQIKERLTWLTGKLKLTEEEHKALMAKFGLK